MAPVATSGRQSEPDVLRATTAKYDRIDDHVPVSTKYNVLEDYEGGYRFAPIEEAQVSRAMIKRRVPAPRASCRLEIKPRPDISPTCTKEPFPTWLSLAPAAQGYLAHII